MAWRWGHCAQLDRIEAGQRLILQKLQTLIAKDTTIMATLDDVQSEVQAEKTVVDSAKTLLEGLSQQLKDALGDPAKIQAIIDQIDANKQELADAVAANTPAQ